MLGRYQLLCEIARGGMASVYLGRTRGMGGFERVVAIKCCHPHLRDDEDFAAMFLDEARLAAMIHHPNVVGTLDVGEGDALYLVMEYIEGDRLLGLLKAASKRGETVPVPIALRIALDALSGLHAAHELRDPQGALLNVVHRDVSPHNILVGVDGVTRITDFGVAKAAQRASVTREGTVKGKLPYMAPELFDSSGADRRADLFSMGVVLWEMLAGERLFRADTDAGTLKQVLHKEIPPPSSRVAAIPPELDAVVLRALERDPAKRFATAAEFADALEALPVRVASTRAAAAYADELLAATVSARRALIARLGDAPTRAAQTLSADTTVQSEARRIWGNGETSRSVDAPPKVIDSAPPAARPHRAPVTWVALALLTAIGVAVALKLALPHGERSTAAATASAATRVAAAAQPPALPAATPPTPAVARTTPAAMTAPPVAPPRVPARAATTPARVAPAPAPARRPAAPPARRAGRGNGAQDDFLPGAI